MKRLTLLLLALALLLAGCVRAPEQTTPLEELLKPEQLPPPPQTPAAPQTASDPLPPSGVWTDESAYTPRPVLTAKYVRPEGDLSRFVPGQGPVYPYCAGENLYGFCTADGTLVTDPIYEQVGIIYDYEVRGNSKLYSVIAHPAGPEDLPLRGAVALDGSFAIKCAYDSMYCRGRDVECRLGGGLSDYDWYDQQGNLLFSVRGQEYEFSADIPEERREELFLVKIYDSPDDYVPDYYFIRPDGTRKLGPYPGADAFSEGLACVSGDGSRYGYIDETGAWAIPPRYDSNDPDQVRFRDGRAIQHTDDGDVLIDREGNVLLACHSNGMARSDDGFAAAWDDSIVYYDRDGNERRRESTGENWYGAEGNVVYSRDGTDFLLRSRDDPDRQARMPLSQTHSWPRLTGVLDDGQFTRAFISDDYDNMIRYWVSEDLLRSGSVPLPPYMSPGMGWYWTGFFRPPFADDVLYDRLTDEPCYPVLEQNRVLLFDGEGTLLWTVSPTDKVTVIGGRLGVVTDRDFTYYEPDDSVGFRFPFFVFPGD